MKKLFTPKMKGIILAVLVVYSFGFSPMNRDIHPDVIKWVDMSIFQKISFLTLVLSIIVVWLPAHKSDD